MYDRILVAVDGSPVSEIRVASRPVLLVRDK